MSELITTGFHHVTLVCRDARKTLRFYRDILGLALVKVTVNFDRTDTYHLYLGNEIGAPGSLLTFFEWPEAMRGRYGVGGIHHVALGTTNDDTLLMWMKDEQWSQVRGTSLDGFFYVTREVLNGMLLRKAGRIINVVSLSGLKGMAGQTNYSAAKAGVIGATKALAQEIAKRNITVNAVAPGFIQTDMTSDLNEKELKAMIPANRFGKPEEVAHAVAFFASPESGYITGTVLSVNGGLYT